MVVWDLRALVRRVRWVLHVGLVEVRDAAERHWVGRERRRRGGGRGGDARHEGVLACVRRRGSCLGRRRLRSRPGPLGCVHHKLDGVN